MPFLNPLFLVGRFGSPTKIDYVVFFFFFWGGGRFGSPTKNRLPRVSMTLPKWGRYPKLRGHGPMF